MHLDKAAIGPNDGVLRPRGRPEPMSASRLPPGDRAFRVLQRWWIVAAGFMTLVGLLIAFTIGAFSAPRRVARTQGISRAALRPLPPARTHTPRSRAPTPTPRPAPPSAAAAPSPLRRGARVAFERLLAGLPGRVQVALLSLAGGSATQLGGDDPAHGWSTTKVLVLVALMRVRGPPGLTASERDEAHAAITESDNQSIVDLFGDLESIEGGLAGASNYMQGLLRASGDHKTMVTTAPPPPGAVTTFGQTEWPPGEAVRFFRALALGRLLPAAPTSYILRLMENIIPSESWGLGSGGFTVPVAFKGGWGPLPSGSYQVRQSGIIDPNSPGGVVVSIVAYPPVGADSFAIGTEMLTRVAEWLSAELLPRGSGLGNRGRGS